MAASLGDYIFLGICVVLGVAIWQGITRGTPAVQDTVKRQQEALKKAGVNLEGGTLKFKTDRRAPTREEYIDRAQRAVASAGEAVNEHRHGVSWGGGDHRQNAEQFFGKRHHTEQHGYVPE